MVSETGTFLFFFYFLPTRHSYNWKLSRHVAKIIDFRVRVVLNRDDARRRRGVALQLARTSERTVFVFDF